MQKHFSNKSIKLKYEDMKINQNNSEYTQWGENSFNNRQFSIKFSQIFNDKFRIDLIFMHRDISDDSFDTNSVFLKFEQSI